MGLAVAVLKGEMRKQRVWDATILDHSTGSLVLVSSRPYLALLWLIKYHGQAVRHVMLLCAALVGCRHRHRCSIGYKALLGTEIAAIWT